MVKSLILLILSVCTTPIHTKNNHPLLTDALFALDFDLNPMLEQELTQELLKPSVHEKPAAPPKPPTPTVIPPEPEAPKPKPAPNKPTLYVPQESIPLYVIFSPSHKMMFQKWFWSSLKDEYKIMVHTTTQSCSSGEYMKEGWNETMLAKVDVILKAIKDNWDKVFIYADVDIQFFRPTWPTIESMMEKRDMVIQKNSPSGEVCAGFFACRANEKTLKLWQHVRATMIEDETSDDQTPLDNALRSTKEFNVTWAYLPDTFMNGWTFRLSSWVPFIRPTIPKNVVLHHANWCKGVKEKITQLGYVKARVQARG